MTSTPRQQHLSPTHELGDPIIPTGPRNLTPNGSRMPAHTFNSPTQSSLSRYNSNSTNSPIRSTFGVQKAQTKYNMKRGRKLPNGKQAPVAPDTAYQGPLDGPDLDHPNPFGTRSRIIGGERYPVMKGKQPFVSSFEKYSSPTRLTSNTKTPLQTNGSPLRQPRPLPSRSPVRTPVLRKPQLPPGPQALKAIVQSREPQREPLTMIKIQSGDGSQLSSQHTPADGSELDVELPITPSKRRGILSPRTQQRKLETLISGGKTKAKRKLVDSSVESPGRARKARPLLSIPALTDEEIEYHELLSAQILALQAEIAEIDEEIDMQRRQIEEKPPGSSNALNDFISGLLQQNDRSMVHLVEPVDDGSALRKMDISSHKPIDKPSQVTLLRRFSALMFNDLKPESSPMTPSTIEKRRYSFNGFSEQRLLHFNIGMVVKLRDYPTVDELQVVVSPWARPELAPFLQNSIRDNNISSCLYAINSYASLSRRRAENLAHLHIKYPDLLHQSRDHRKQSLNRSDNDLKISGMVVGRRDLVLYLSQQRLKFRRKYKDGERHLPDVQLLLTWSIKLDAVGTACSDVHADVLTPSTWTDRDRGVYKRTDNISEVLRVLIKDKGVFEGICALVDSLYKTGK